MSERVYATVSLLPQHQALIDNSAISPKIARDRGYRSITDPNEILALGFSHAQARVPGLLTPITDIWGQNGSHTYRPDDPRVDDKGKPRKYENPPGIPLILDVPKVCRTKLQDPSLPLWITESSRKADALVSLGFLAVAVTGVWGWRATNELGGVTTLPELESIAWKGKDVKRNVVLCFDSDVLTNPIVNLGVRRLGAWIHRRGSKISYAILPHPETGKNGVDDYIHHGATRDDLLNTIETFLPAIIDQNPPVPMFGGVLVSDVESEHVRWMWKQRLAHKKITVLDGDPGLGKSTAVLDIAARVSTGAPFPGETERRDPKGVVILSAEDGLSDTIRPRLEVAGADLTRIFAMTHVGDEKNPGTVSIPDSLQHVEDALLSMQASLLIIDPLMAYFSPSINANNDQQVRSALRPLAAMLERTEAACVMVRHLNKSDSRTALYRGGGSIGIIGAARFGMVVARDPDDPFARIIAVTKCNLGIEPPSLRYTLEGVMGTDVARVVWDANAVPYNAADLLSREDRDDDDETGEATRWLKGILEKGAVTADWGKKEARKAGYSDRDLRRAKKALHVEARPDSFGGEWTWYLPGGPQARYDSDA